MTDGIDPARAAYAFANRFVNVLVTLPNGRPLRTAGRCGGMAYSMLDHAAAGQDVPSWSPGLFAPAPVPPDGHLLADHLRARQLDSFRSVSALRFLAWSVLPDDDAGPLDGVRTRTRRELPRVLRALAEGRPVVLGLVVARGLLRSGDNHQVIATGFTRDAAGGVVLRLLDPNTPRREVTLVETPDGWRASNGRLWRGFFRHAYAPRTPPAIPSASRRPTARVRSGVPVALAHVATGRLLVIDDGVVVLQAAGSTTWTPSVSRTGSGDLGATGLLADAAHVRLVATGTAAASSLALVDGDATLVVVEPELPDDWAPGDDTTAGSDATVGSGRPPADDRTGPGGSTSARGPVIPDATAPSDSWHVVVDGDGAWREGSRVRLVHVPTGALLAGTSAGVTATYTPDPSTWWTVAAS